MKYTLFKLQFTSAAHFGTGGLTVSSDTLMADTVFSALCTEAARAGAGPEKLIQAVRDGRIRISDAMPYIGDRFYVPRPLAEITTDKEGNSSVKKALKKLSYLPADGLSSYIKGTMEIEKEADILGSCLGQSFLLEKAAVDTGEETRPYSVGLYRYYDGSGLYICLGCESDKDYNLFTEMLEILSYAGIGGKTSAGYGRFCALPVKPGKEMEKRLELKSFGQAMSLSVCLPLPLEMEKAMENAGLRLVKRSGWVSSVPEAEAIRKRRDIYMFAAGSVFRNRFEGSLYDLGSNDAHPVLRYGYPMFMGVE